MVRVFWIVPICWAFGNSKREEIGRLHLHDGQTRLTPDQLRAVKFVEETARTHGMNIYLTGGTIRDLMTGFPIRDLDFTVQGNPLKFQKELEKFGARVESADSVQ